MAQENEPKILDDTKMQRIITKIQALTQLNDVRRVVSGASAPGEEALKKAQQLLADDLLTDIQAGPTPRSPGVC